MVNYNYAISPYSDDLYHYGVKGMKWGVRRKHTSSSGSSIGSKTKKVALNMIERKRQKNQKRNESYNKTTKYFGVGGAAIRSYTENQSKKAVKGVLVQAINGAANAYISNNSSNYRISRGVDFVRNASIKGLSISARMDDLRFYADVARSAIYRSGM